MLVCANLHRALMDGVCRSQPISGSRSRGLGQKRGSIMKAKQIFAGAVILGVLALCTNGPAVAQTGQPALPQWAAIVHQLALKDSSAGFSTTVPTGIFPPLIPAYLPSLDPDGVVETYNLGAPTLTGKNAFFQSLGSN